jgi:DNA processing protein
MEPSILKRDKNGEDLVDDELASWLAFSVLSGPGIGPQKAKLLLERFGSLNSAWHASETQLRAIRELHRHVVDKFLSVRHTIEPARLLNQVQSSQMRALDFYHPLYPADLREIHDPPLVLFMKGKLRPEELTHCVGVVGTRHPTAYGQRLAKQIAKGLAENGVTVVSGMAVGIDSFAHYGAIEGKGRTLAVLASGVDVCYPSSNRPLYTKLVTGENGAVLSEFLPGTKPEKWRFPARNRLISGISQCLAVIEAGETSGSLITARLAFEQNRDVFALPGRVDSPMSQGTNGLIVRNMARLLSTHEEILVDKGWVPAPQAGTTVPTVVELYGREREVFEQITNEPVHFDYLSEKLGMNAGELSATLTMLELAGIVTRLPGDWYARQPAVTTI